MRRTLSFLASQSPEYLESLEQQYRTDPNSVSADWAFFFEVLDLARPEPSDTSDKAPGEPAKGAVSSQGISPELLSQVEDEFRVIDLINAYRMRGHLKAKLDPLRLSKPMLDHHLELSYFKLDKVSPTKVFKAAAEIGLPPSTLPQIVEHLEQTYCQKIGIEFHYIRDEKVYQWLKERIDRTKNHTDFTREQKISVLHQLYKASLFEAFLQTNYLGQKRFSLEGGEAVIPALLYAIDVCARFGASEVLIGMAHRGRLNVLANIMQKPYQEIFKEFEGAALPQLEEVSGDVKYHMGFSTDVKTVSGYAVHLSLATNPSHLEFVNPVVQGVARAKQDLVYQADRNKVVPFLIHGDAAVIGQGIVTETLNLSQLEGYRTGGTVHLVINNQIGFTTSPSDSRSTVYCTDFAKAINAPILHVNGDSVEDVVHAMMLAAEFRMRFQQDVFVDVVCYRKYGHNEGDEPRFTQPLMYSVIDQHPSSLSIYLDKLRADEKVENELVDQMAQNFEKELTEKKAEVQRSPKILTADLLGGAWKGLERPSVKVLWEPTDTRISAEIYERVIETIHTIPSHIKPLPKFVRMIEQRLERIQKKDEIDWAVGEQLGFGSLLLAGNPVRISGQDSTRGTFSHRHAALTDSLTGERYYPLRHLAKAQAPFTVFDSPLSEAGVLGFDYGFSVASPKSLVCWEAQFGDFSNGAQVIIDQFISSAETKWYRMSGITLLLPHGYEGQGPEHSSARLERYLQLCAQHNMQVIYPTTPAQYCHALRRQMVRRFRRPLVVMTPKSLLRRPEVFSRKKDFIDGNFHNLIIENFEASRHERVILCSGKVYWDLVAKADELKVRDKLLFVRVEQLYPLDKKGLQDLKAKTGALPWFWVQEEPKNMGAWSFMKLQLLDADIDIQYIGRPAAASPATGSHLRHQEEQEALLTEALGKKSHLKEVSSAKTSSH